MKKIRGEEGFWRTFDHYAVPSEWQQELYNYIILGYHPGSFHTAMFENNLSRAVHTSHVANDWQSITGFMKWVMHIGPNECWGSRGKVQAWLELTKEQRRKICEEKRLVLTEKELMWEIMSDK